MLNLIKSVAIMMAIVILQLVIYNQFLKPIICTWGASQTEVSMPMAGDNPHLKITSTRAIVINAPKSEVWRWLIQLGADRGGFYSYEFIEAALGYKTRVQKIVEPEFTSIKVGDVVRGSIDEKRSLIPYNFRVLNVKPDDTLVLDQWGTFLLTSVNVEQTRLIIRTQETKATTAWEKIGQYIAIPTHFIMERGTLIGIKARAEMGPGAAFSQTKNIIWFMSLILAAICIDIIVFVGRGLFQTLIMPVIFSMLWLVTLFLLNPIPFYSLILLLWIVGYLFYVLRGNYQ